MTEFDTTSKFANGGRSYEIDAALANKLYTPSKHFKFCAN